MNRNQITQSGSTRQLIIASLFTALTAAGAFIRIPFPLAPLTLQTLVTLLAGSVLLPRYAFLSQAVYILIGLIGLPVFTNGGGPGYVLQPTFGYLLSLPIAAWAISFTFCRLPGNQSLLYRLCINSVAAVWILLFGSIWLYACFKQVLHKPLSLSVALMSGMVIFIPGELLKAVIAAYLSPKIKKPA